MTSVHIPIYFDPVEVKAGEALVFTGKSDNWDGHIWLWAIAADGRQGWVPDDLAHNKDGRHFAAYSYSARELRVTLGEQITVEKASHGWAWCLNTRGNIGWVPQKCLSILR